ncbi:hypothetical protein BTA51_06110 [Hahella sp. CCB-MM4]|uniref:DUF1722 domain-containing protein n=1 Tax=Hahella sp. (strain CCB-MM4) TaxID=1926491 RepID=UPI000B9B08C8|nr:DUF1722 domain-containing protein [Hahella sp. CCB-MM4]OZG74569.1 hypothetical protein BTA51_06110 [Hahella sp. CCB-MM4]
MTDCFPDPGYSSDEQILVQIKEFERQLALENEPALKNKREGKIALYQRRWNLLMAEMTLRHGPVRPFIHEISEPLWPSQPDSEDLLPYSSSDGRIPLPANSQQLWAQHKYSVMARSPSLYQSIGPELARGALTIRELWLQLETSLQQAPNEGGLRNAVQHMWGYIKSSSSLKPDTAPLPHLFREIQQQALRQQCQYLLHSTALGEFAYWCWRLYPDNGALTSTHSTDSAC